MFFFWLGSADESSNVAIAADTRIRHSRLFVGPWGLGSEPGSSGSYSTFRCRGAAGE